MKRNGIGIRSSVIPANSAVAPGTPKRSYICGVNKGKTDPIKARDAIPAAKADAAVEM
jgi:hypothetical protein